jgi:ribose-phosphate pyrophosphokinase
MGGAVSERIAVFSGTAHRALGDAVARALELEPGRCVLGRFPDGEHQVAVESSVEGQDVFLVQPLSPPAGEPLMELLLLADACRRSGAARVTAVIPYLAYARQDRRARGGEPLGARTVANLLEAGGLDRFVLVDLHSAAVEGCFRGPLEHLTAAPLLAARLGQLEAGPSVVVSPDLGGAKLAERYGRALGLPVVVIHKSRLSGSEVTVKSVIGEVKGRRAIIVDDLISTAGTVQAAAEAVLEEGALPELVVCATHGLFSPPALERLGGLPLSRLVVTDSLPQPDPGALPLEVVPLAPTLAQAVRRVHRSFHWR